MANQIDSVSIEGMKQTDFMQLREIFKHVMEENARWERLDWWDTRNERLAVWLDQVNESLIDVKIKDRK